MQTQESTNWTMVRQAVTDMPQQWANSFAKQFLLGHQFPQTGLDPNKTTVIGGICSLFTGDSEAIRKNEVTFSSIAEFDAWIRSWYPRKDQVWNTVGAPPKTVSRIFYVVEDSLFAARVAKWTGLPVAELEYIFRAVHQELGAPAVREHLAAYGWYGELTPVYTSQIKKEHELALRIWERMMGNNFRAKDRDMAMVALMYTSLWPEVLGIACPVVIYEPHDHMYFPEFAPHFMREWFFQNQYGAKGVNKDLGILGYQGYQCNGQSSRPLPHWAV